MYESQYEDQLEHRAGGSPTPGTPPRDAWSSPTSEGVAEMNEALAAPLPVDGAQEVCSIYTRMAGVGTDDVRTPGLNIKDGPIAWG